MLLNTATFSLEEWVLGHNMAMAGVNWPHVIQIGASVTFLVSAALIGARALRLPVPDVAWLIGRRWKGRPWRSYALGQMAIVLGGVALLIPAALAVSTVLPSDVVLAQEEYCPM